MKHQQKAWLVAYDISEPRRLKRVHRLLRKEGVPAQFSAFTVEADDQQIEGLLDKLRTLIDQGADDLRAYHLPANCPVWTLGAQHWPDGMCLSGSLAAKLLTNTRHVATASTADAPEPEATPST